MTLADAQEFTALDNPAFQLVSQIFLGQVPSKYIAPGVKTFTTLDPSIKVVSLHIELLFSLQLMQLCDKKNMSVEIF